jgi:integrase
MPRKSSVPKYRLHKSSGRAVVTLPDGLGGRYDVQLGEYGSAESRERYARAIAEWEAAGRRRGAGAQARAGSSVNEIALAFLDHCNTYHRRPDGSPTNEVSEYKLSIRPLRELYGMTPAGAFTPKGPKVVRQQMLDADLSRGVVNQRIGRLKRLFKWAVAEGLVPAAVFQALACVPGIPRGRGLARETEPVKPVPEVFVESIRDFVLPEVWAMIELQRLTGMRPGEVSTMRAIDIDRSGAIWFYRPAQHKTAWRGRDRVIAIGARAQTIVREFLTAKVDDYLFSPRRAIASKRARLRALRKTPVQPSQVDRSKPNPKKQPGESYGTCEYAKAIAAGCNKADAAQRRAATNAAIEAGKKPPEPDVEFVPKWSPNRLRHNYATMVRKRFGLEAAQVALGHARADVTQVYAERDLSLAEQIAAKIG